MCILHKEMGTDPIKQRTLEEKFENMNVSDLLKLKEGDSLSKEVDRSVGHALKVKIKSSELLKRTVQFQTSGPQV